MDGTGSEGARREIEEDRVDRFPQEGTYLRVYSRRQSERLQVGSPGRKAGRSEGFVQ